MVANYFRRPGRHIDDARIVQQQKVEALRRKGCAGFFAAIYEILRQRTKYQWFATKKIAIGSAQARLQTRSPYRVE